MNNTIAGVIIEQKQFGNWKEYFWKCTNMDVITYPVFVRFLGIGAAKISDEAAGGMGSATLIFTKCKKTVRYVG